MDKMSKWPNIIFTIFIIILVICILVATIIVSKNKIKEIHFVQKDIPRFSVDIHFDPYPQVVDIENQYDCNVKSLRKCDINDPTTLFGCKELIVKCHHFDKDTPYVENNVTTTIPKNSIPTEGYALAITTIAEACNPYHGDLTLVTANAESNEYMLICTCKNPGYIGNETLLGNCTSVFICNGKIDNVDKPLKEINCICDKLETSVRYDDGLPVCKELLVHEANELYSDWANIVPWNSDRQIDATNYNVTVSGNLKSSRLLDPCRNSLHDSSFLVNGNFNSERRECVLNGSGYPVVNGLLKFIPSEKDQPGVSAVLATGNWETIRFSDNIAGKRKMYGIIAKGIHFDDRFNSTKILLQPPNGISLARNAALNFVSKNGFYAPQCVGNWPTYHCYVKEKGSNNYYELQHPLARRCPGEFLWSREEWNNNEFLVADSLTSNNAGLSLSAINLTKVGVLQAYGLQWTDNDGPTDNGVLSFNSKDDYERHKNVVTN